MSVNPKSEWCPNQDSFSDREIRDEALRKLCAEGFATCNSCGRFIGLQTCGSWKNERGAFVKLYRHKLPEFLKAPKRARKKKKQKYYRVVLHPVIARAFEEEAKKNSSSSTE